jgi:hypothetical protein
MRYFRCHGKRKSEDVAHGIIIQCISQMSGPFDADSIISQVQRHERLYEKAKLKRKEKREHETHRVIFECAS